MIKNPRGEAFGLKGVGRNQPMEDRVDQVSEVRLTPREIEVVRYVALGLNMNELAVELNISPKTVGHHIAHATTKMKARNKAHLVARALALGLIEQVPVDDIVAGEGQAKTGEA